MKRWMRILASTVLAGSMLATMLPMGALAAEDTTVSLSEATVLKHGRTYEKNGTLYLDWSNSGITFNFEGTGAKAVITSSSLNPNPGYMNVYVDGALAPTSLLKLDKLSAEYTLASGLTAGKHTISLRKRNEAVYGGSATVGLVSLTITDGALTAAPQMAERRIEVIGDSITAGFGNLAANTSVPYNSHVSDGTSTYATLTAQALNAEIDVIARSGIRFVRADMKNSMYPVYEQVSGLENKCTDPYDFENNQKDVVIINLGTNDNGATLDGVRVTDEYIQSETKEFLKLVRQNNPTAEIVWAYGIMGSGRADAIQAAIKEMTDAGDSHISFYALDQIKPSREGYGSGNHPTVITAINRSFGLTEYIAQKMGWNDYQYSAQLAQQLRMAENYTDDYLKMYSENSIQALKSAIAAAKDLPTGASNADIKAAVDAVQTAHMGLTIDMEEAAVLGAEEKSATSHHMQVNYPMNVDITPFLGHKMYLSYEITVETPHNPTDNKWLSYVRNGRAYLTNASGKEIEIKQGITLGSELLEKAATGWATDTIEIPDTVLETTGFTNFRLFLYNDTGNMPASEKGDIAWSNDNGVTIKVRNVKLMMSKLSFVNKDSLEEALASQKTDDGLSSYTDESIAEYKKLFADAQAVYDDENATQLQINEAVASLRSADKVLKLRDENVVAVIMSDVKTSNEAHYLSVDYAPGEAIDLTPYAGNELKISYDIRINTTENHPDPKAVGWLNTIRNGKIQLFSVPANEADANKNGFPVGGDDQGRVHCKQGELTDIEANTWLTVTMPVPQAILDAGKITKFHMYIYNDMNNFNPAWSKDAGVTMSLRNVQISKIGGTVVTPADKTALNAAIAAAKAKVEADYTVESWAVMAAKLTAAEATAAKADATQAEVDTAANELNAAIAALVVKPTPVIVYGDLTHDGQVKAEDALKALQAVTSKITLTAEEEIAADVDNVKGVSAADALMILQHATGKISRFPVENTTPDPKPQTDKTALNAAVNAAKAMTNLDAYTDETVSAFTEALTKAEAVAAKEDATQDEIDVAKAALEAAQAGLTAKPVPPQPDDPDDGDGLGSGDGADDTLKG